MPDRFPCNSRFFFFFAFSSLAHAQNFNSSCFNSEISEDNFNIVVRDTTKISPHSIVLLGEIHRVDANFLIFKNIIKRLNHSNNFRDVIVERSYAEAYLFNKFLESNDLYFLRFDVTWCEEMREFFIDLFRYNSELPQENKVRFHGIDAVLSLSQVILFLKTIIPHDLPPSEIKQFIDSLSNINLPLKKEKEESIKYADVAMNNLRNEIGSNLNIHKTFFGENFIHLDFLLKSKSTLTMPGSRNKNMYLNLLRIIKEFRIESSKNNETFPFP